MSEPSPTPKERPPGVPTGLVVAVVVGVLFAVAVVGGAVTLMLAGSGGAGEPDLAEVEVIEGLSYEHTPGSVDYPQTPPVGGDHDAVWWECGVYDEPIRDENAVHALEHGTVWITHRDDLDDEERARLADQLPGNGILSPYPDQEAPVEVTVWGRQLELTGPDDPRLELFIGEYGDGHTSREPEVGCFGGTTDRDVDPWEWLEEQQENGGGVPV